MINVILCDDHALIRRGIREAYDRFHDYERVERLTGVKFYFANPYHSWERGTNENTNGLIRQYIPKGMCLRSLTQTQCDWIANELNNRPRERLGFKTPAEVIRLS